jgi:hypothetical protein
MAWELVEEGPASYAGWAPKGPASYAGWAPKPLPKIGRNISRQVSNIGTRAVGLPGDILSTINEYAAKPLSKAITGKKPLEYEETLLGKILPTTETHRKGIEEITGEYFKPQN